MHRTTLDFFARSKQEWQLHLAIRAALAEIDRLHDELQTALNTPRVVRSAGYEGYEPLDPICRLCGLRHPDRTSC